MKYSLKFDKIFSTDEYSIDFKKEELKKNSEFKKLNEETKQKIYSYFESTSILGAQLKCNNCNFKKEITETILLYQLDVHDKTNKIKNLEENKLTTKNPILPRTHDYICKNFDCLTNTNNEKKEAVFIKEKNSNKINYICCICYHNW